VTDTTRQAKFRIVQGDQKVDRQEAVDLLHRHGVEKLASITVDQAECVLAELRKYELDSDIPF
jgi:hypothetical protein